MSKDKKKERHYQAKKKKELERAEKKKKKQEKLREQIIRYSKEIIALKRAKIKSSEFDRSKFQSSGNTMQNDEKSSVLNEKRGFDKSSWIVSNG